MKQTTGGTPSAPAASCPEEPVNWDGLLPISQVLTHVRPAYGGDTWAEALEWLRSSPSERQVIDELLASINETSPRPSVFAEPIVIHDERLDDIDEDDEDDDEDDEDDEGEPGLRLANGMHRVAAAVAAGHTHILCASGYPEGTDTEYVEVQFELATWPDPEAEDAMDFAAGWLRSFPLPDRTWVETIGISGHGETIEALWCCPHDLVKALLAEVTRRAPGIVISKVRPVTAAELDAEYEALGIA